MLITGYTCKERATRKQILFEKLSLTQYKNNIGNVAWGEEYETRGPREGRLKGPCIMVITKPKGYVGKNF